MSKETIGKAWPTGDHAVMEEGVVFTIPYGDGGYNILLRNNELDSLLKQALEKLLANKPINGFDYAVDLGQYHPGRAVLPLYIGAISIKTDPGASYYARQDLDMEVGVTTMSFTYNHRGILQTQRAGVDGKWSYLDYGAAPPLRELDYTYA